LTLELIKNGCNEQTFHSYDLGCVFER